MNTEFSDLSWSLKVPVIAAWIMAVTWAIIFFAYFIAEIVATII